MDIIGFGNKIVSVCERGPGAVYVAYTQSDILWEECPAGGCPITHSQYIVEFVLGGAEDANKILQESADKIQKMELPKDVRAVEVGGVNLSSRPADMIVNVEHYWR